MAKKNIQTDIVYFHDYDVHIPTRTIYIGSVGFDGYDETGVDNFMAERTIKALHILDNTTDSDKPISIIMNNPGGDWYHGMAIYDAIKTCQNHVTITCYGYCMSMGSVILQAADERVMAPSSRLMIHYGSNGFGGHSITFDKHAEENKKINKEMEDIYLEKIKEKKPRYNRKKLSELLNFDTFLNPEESIELGLCDKIIQPKNLQGI